MGYSAAYCATHECPSNPRTGLQDRQSTTPPVQPPQSAIRKEVMIGDCRLLLGDARSVVPALQKIGAIVSDPPFGMAFRSNHRTVQHEAIANDGNTDLLVWACSLQAEHSKYIFCRWDNLAELPKPKSMVTWVKNNWSMGDLEHEHARQTEVALFYPGSKHDFPNGRPTDVIEAPRTGNTFHPTEKPVQLMMAILRWTRGVVLDPFMGSGKHRCCMRSRGALVHRS
jgi:site-specific DNA-methyltransferase (adenine-specific)